MKLNQRDKILLVGVLVVLIWVVGIMFFIKPAFESVSSANQTLDSKEMELQGLQAQIKEDENLPQEVDDAYKAAIDVANIFYDKMQQHAVATQVQTFLDDYEITNLNLQISGMKAQDFGSYTYEPDIETTTADAMLDSVNAADPETKPVEAVAPINVQVSDYVLSFSYRAQKKNLLEFLNSLPSNTHRSLVVTEMTIADVGENKDDTEVTGTITMNFMMLPNLPNPADVDSQKAETEKVNAEEEAAS